MTYPAPQNQASTTISVTNTATLLYPLMDTAGSIATSQTYYEGQGCNGMMITPEGYGHFVTI